MRPRFLINLINHCKSFAVNLNHSQIIENDITKGLFTFSADVLTDLTLEIRDLYSNYDNILASFYLAKEKLSQSQLVELLAEQVEEQNIIEEIIEILLWYGFLGVQISHEEIVFIYDLTYNIELLKTIIRKKGDSVLYVINPAFIPSLRIKTV